MCWNTCTFIFSAALFLHYSLKCALSTYQVPQPIWSLNVPYCNYACQGTDDLCQPCRNRFQCYHSCTYQVNACQSRPLFLSLLPPNCDVCDQPTLTVVHMLVVVVIIVIITIIVIVIITIIVIIIIIHRLYVTLVVQTNTFLRLLAHTWCIPQHTSQHCNKSQQDFHTLSLLPDSPAKFSPSKIGTQQISSHM